MANASSHDGLKYVGGASIIGIPARDLTAEEVEQYGRRALLASGLYVEYETKRVYTPKPRKAVLKGETAENQGEIENERD